MAERPRNTADIIFDMINSPNGPNSSQIEEIERIVNREKWGMNTNNQPQKRRVPKTPKEESFFDQMNA